MLWKAFKWLCYVTYTGLVNNNRMWDEAWILMQQKTYRKNKFLRAKPDDNYYPDAKRCEIFSLIWATELQESQLAEVLSICSSCLPGPDSPAAKPSSQGREHIISAVEALNLAVLALTIWTLSRGNALLWLTGVINSAQWLVMPLVIKQVSKSGRRGIE